MTVASLARNLVRRTENWELPLGALEAVRDLRRHLVDMEKRVLVAARQRGASVEDLAAAVGITRQAVYYKIHQLDGPRPGRDSSPIVEIPDLPDRPAATTARGHRS